MSRKVLVPLAEGFEEVEAVSIVDVLRRAGLDVTTAAAGGDTTVRGSHDIPVLADIRIEDAVGRNWDAVVLPGGMPGSRNLAGSDLLRRIIRSVIEQGGIAAAVCAAPIALHAAGVLNGKRVTAYPGFEKELSGAVYTGRRVERDGEIITGIGPGAAIEFALAVAEALGAGRNAAELRKRMILTGDASALS